MPRDELTARYFNQDVFFDSPETFSLGDFILDGRVAAALTGALDGSSITLSLCYSNGDRAEQPSGARLTVRHPFFARPAEYEIAQTDTGYAWLTTEYLVLLPEHTGKGLGIRIFAHQVHTADLLGLHQIWLNAVGDGKDSIYNGSYTWARYGFDATFEAAQKVRFAERFPGVVDLVALMATEEGRAQWKARGFTSMMCFDLQDEQCWNRLEAYMDHKGVVI